LYNKEVSLFRTAPLLRTAAKGKGGDSVNILNPNIPNLMDDLMGYENIIMNNYGKIFIPKGLSMYAMATHNNFYINNNFNDRVFEVSKLDSKTNIVKIRYVGSSAEGCTAELDNIHNLKEGSEYITGEIENYENKARIE
jgi:hypothetical protein